MTPAEAVAIRVRELRLAQGLTQGAMSRRTGMTRPNVARLEGGMYEPTLRTLARVAAALGTTVADLVSTVEPKP